MQLNEELSQRAEQTNLEILFQRPLCTIIQSLDPQSIKQKVAANCDEISKADLSPTTVQ